MTEYVFIAYLWIAGAALLGEQSYETRKDMGWEDWVVVTLWPISSAIWVLAWAGGVVLDAIKSLRAR